MLSGVSRVLILSHVKCKHLLVSTFLVFSNMVQIICLINDLRRKIQIPKLNSVNGFLDTIQSAMTSSFLSSMTSHSIFLLFSSL